MYIDVYLYIYVCTYAHLRMVVHYVHIHGIIHMNICIFNKYRFFLICGYIAPQGMLFDATAITDAGVDFCSADSTCARTAQMNRIYRE